MHYLTCSNSENHLSIFHAASPKRSSFSPTLPHQQKPSLLSQHHPASHHSQRLFPTQSPVLLWAPHTYFQLQTHLLQHLKSMLCPRKQSAKLGSSRMEPYSHAS